MLVWLVFLPSCCSWQGTPLQTQGEILPVLYNVFTLLILNGIHSLSVKNAAPLSFNKFSSLYSNVHEQKCIYHKSGFFLRFPETANYFGLYPENNKWKSCSWTVTNRIWNVIYLKAYNVVWIVYFSFHFLTWGCFSGFPPPVVPSWHLVHRCPLIRSND